MPKMPWDGEAVVYSQTLDRYFSAPNDAEVELEGEQTLADLRLVICTPNCGRRLGEDYFSDDLAEDGELPSSLTDAIVAFNAALALAPVLSWSAGKVALLIEPALSDASCGISDPQ